MRRLSTPIGKFRQYKICYTTTHDSYIIRGLMNKPPHVSEPTVPPPHSMRGLHPLVQLLWQRAQSQSRRGARQDNHTIALAIEGGGIAGIISAGMCVFLEAAGLIDAVDRIYGSSSGALNGSYTAAGQAAYGSLNYLDAATRRVANPLRLLVGRPAIDFDFLFDNIIRSRRPYDVDGFRQGPDFRALAINLDTRKPEVLNDFQSVEELLKGVRASCSLPLLAGPYAIFREKRMTDGGMLAAFPYRPALADGATDVLVLRTRPAAYRKKPYPQAALNFIKRLTHPAIASFFDEWFRQYNLDAQELIDFEKQHAAHLLQINPPEDADRLRMIGYSRAKVRRGLATGFMIAAHTFGVENVRLKWSASPGSLPKIYLT